MVAALRSSLMVTKGLPGADVTVTGTIDTEETYASQAELDAAGLMNGEQAIDDVGNVYKLARFRDADTSQFEPVGYREFSGGSFSATSVTRDESVQQGNIAAGVAMADVTRDHYGWMMVSGFTSVAKGNAAITSPALLCIDDANDGRAEVQTALNDANLRKRLGYASADATAAAATVRVMLRGLL